MKIPERLHQKLETSTKQAKTTKSEIIICALAQYLGNTKDIPITQRNQIRVKSNRIRVGNRRQSKRILNL